jgi:hypothetical protein
MAEVESNFNPKAKNVESGASGLFQYLHLTAGEENIDPFDVVEAAAATGKRMRRQIATLSKVGVNSPGLSSVYLCHNQGVKGFMEIIECLHGQRPSLSDARLRNMGANLPPTEKIKFSTATTHQDKSNVFISFWEERMQRALKQVTE